MLQGTKDVHPAEKDAKEVPWDRTASIRQELLILPINRRRAQELSKADCRWMMIHYTCFIVWLSFQVIYNRIINDNKQIILRPKAHFFSPPQTPNTHQEIRTQRLSLRLLHLQIKTRGEEVKHQKIILSQHLQRKLSSYRKTSFQ